MKVIDLLNKIANGEVVPKEIKFKNILYTLIEYDVSTRLYHSIEEPYEGLDINTTDLNDEVEIIEEDKKIEKIPYQFSLNYIDSNIDSYTKEEINKTINHIYGKMNEIIDKINEGE